MADIDRAEELNPLHPGILYQVARAHLEEAYYSCPEQYDESRALDAIRKATDKDSDSFPYFCVLGLALYRNGSYREARDALLRYLEHEVDDEESPALFALAMTSWRLGRKSEAFSYYSRAVARMEETYPDSPRFQRLREEAAEVLGIEE
jgi:tetratricopeptide (TPR) repeat protein